MAVDYDLVVIGSTKAGIYAAQQSALMQARVALVTQSSQLLLPNDTIVTSSLRDIGKFYKTLAQADFNLELAAVSDFIPQLSAAWADEMTSPAIASNALNNLSALGVDVIVGEGQFKSEPRLIMQVAKRQLHSRSFLLATGSICALNLPDNCPNQYLTSRQLLEQGWAVLGREIIIVGNNPQAIELSQALGRLGKRITLLIPQSRLLLEEDLDIILMLQAQLEMEGICIYTNAPVSQIKTIEGQKWVQAGDRVLTANEVIVTEPRCPNIAGLNLAEIGVKYSPHKVYINSKLQTTNPQVYACGDVLGGYALPNMAIYEATIILKNALFMGRHKVNYLAQPWAIFTQPSLARVGLTESQARKKYGDRVYVIKKHFTEITPTQVSEVFSGLCKLILKQDGEILGGSLLGEGAVEQVSSIALMMQQNLKLKRNPWQGLTSVSMPAIHPSLAEILEYACQDFYQQKLQQNPKMLNHLRTWFRIRKNWF